MNRGKSLPTPHQKQSQIGGAWAVDRSNQRGRSLGMEEANWPEPLGNGGCSDKLPNCNPTVDNENGYGNFKSSRSIHDALAWTADPYMEALSSEDGCTWAELLALIKAPSDVPANAAANIRISPSNEYVEMNSHSQDNSFISYLSQVERSLESSSNNQDTQIHHPTIEAPYKSTPRKNIDGSDMQAVDSSSTTHLDVTSSKLTNQDNYLTFHPQGSINMLQSPREGFPVPYEPQYGLNMPWRQTNAETSIATSCHFAPATPEQPKKLNHQVHSIQNVSLAQNFSTLTQKTSANSEGNEAVEHQGEEPMGNILDTSFAAISSPLKETDGYGKGSNQDVELNKTPPPKAPKRKKHRPRVVVENKPRRNRRPADPINANSKGNQVTKRKYVRKKPLKGTNNSQGNDTKKTQDSNVEATRSCRRSLNFDSRNQKRDEHSEILFDQQKLDKTGRHSFLSPDTQETCLHTEPDNVTRTATIQTRQWDGLQQDIGPMQTENALSSVMRDLHTENPYVDTNKMNQRANEPYQIAPKSHHVHQYQHNHAGIGQSCLGERPIQESLKITRQQVSCHQQQPETDVAASQARGSKRKHHFTSARQESSPLHVDSSSVHIQESFQVQTSSGSCLAHGYSGKLKKNKIEDGYRTTTSNVIPSTHFAEVGSGQVQTNGGYKSLMNHLAQRISKPSSTSRSVEKPNNSIIHLPQLQFSPTESTERNIQKQQLASGVCSQREELAEKIPTRLPPAYGITSPTAGTENNPQIRTLYRNPLIASHSIQSTVKQHGAPTTSKLNQPITGSQEEQKDLISIAEITLQLESLNINSTNTEMMNNEKTALVPFIGGGSIVPYEILDHIKKRKPRPKVDLDPETNRIWKLLMGKEATEEDKGMDQDKAKWWEEERKIFRGRASSFVSRMRLVQGDRRFSPWKGSVVDSVIGVFLTQNVSDHLSSSAFMSLAARFPVQLMRKTGTCQSDNPVISVEEPEICVLDSDDSIKWQDLLANQTIYNRSPHESLEERRYNLSTGNLNPSSVEGHNCSTEEVISSQDSTESSPCHSSVNFHSFTASTLKPDCPSNGCKSNNTMNSRFDSYPEMENVVHLKEFQSQQLGGSSITMASTGGLGLFDHAGNSKQKYQQSSRIDDLDGSVTAHPFDLNSPYVQPQGATTICYQLPITAGSKALGERTYTLGKDDITYLHSSESGISMTDNVISTSKGTGLVSQSKPTVGQNVQELWQVSPTSIPYATQNKHSTNNTDCTSLGLQAYDSQNSSSSHQNGRVIFPCERTAKELPNRRDVHNSTESTFEAEKRTTAKQKEVIATNNDESNNKEKICILGEGSSRTNAEMINLKEGNNEEWKRTSFDWDSLRREVLSSSKRKERSKDAADSIDYEAIRRADLKEVSKAIKERGMNNVLADRIKDFLDRLIREHGSIDLEWLRDVPPDKAKDYLLSFRGLGLKSVECVRLLTLHQHAFPVDTNVGRIAVRLGWVPLQPLPESLQLHLLELYPMLETIQKYLWPRLCKLDQRTLYELHYQLITFGKVFCTKSKPNCNACPMRGECRHFASAFASARLALPGPEEKSCVVSASPNETNRKSSSSVNPVSMHRLEDTSGVTESESRRYEPIVEEPTTPEPESAEISETDIEDAFYEDPDEIPIIKLNVEEFTTNLQNFMQQNMELQEADMSKALVLINQEAASIPTPKLKNVSRLRTEHQVYELPDQHPLLKELEEREPDDPSPYLLAIWTPGETADSIQPPETRCEFAVQGKMCCKETCFSCNSQRESMSQIVRGTLLIPCRTAMRGSFPLNGTYFQVNEVFADHTSSLNPIDVPRAWIWNLPRRPVYFGTSVSSIFKGMSTEDIQYCFWKGFVCVRGFDQKTRAPRPLMARLHFIASKLEKPKVRANNTRTIR